MRVIDAIDNTKDKGKPACRVEAIGLGGKCTLVLASHADRHPRVVDIAQKQHDTSRWNDAAVENFLKARIGRVQGENGTRKSKKRGKVVKEQGTECHKVTSAKGDATMEGFDVLRRVAITVEKSKYCW